MLIIGHRGAAGLAEENTLRSFTTAQEYGVDMIEMDLRKSNGQIILAHSRWDKDKKNVYLSQVLDLINIPLNLEVKESGFEGELLRAIKNVSSSVLISSKYPSILQKIRALDENIKLGLVIGKGNFFLLPFVARLDRSINLYSVHPKMFLSNSWVIRFLKDLGKKIFVWTINDPNKFTKLEKLGIDGVFTDRPDLIKR